MTRLTVLGHLVLGDFRERTRRYSFLWTMIGTTFFGYLVITGKYTMIFNGFEPVVNSAWVGTLMAMFCTILLTLVGFYLISNTVKRDTREGVGQILATTRLSNRQYLLSKYFSNFLVLVACTSILIVIAVVMQAMSDLSGDFSVVDLLTPFAVITVPMLALVAGVALLFESTRWLRGSFGNVLYLFVVELILVGSLVSDHPLVDPIGSGLFKSSVEQTILAEHPGAKIGVQVGFVGVFEELVQESTVVFHWHGVGWAPGIILPRLGYFGMGLLFVLGASLGFRRFDPALMRVRGPKKKTLAPAHTETVPTVASSNLSAQQIILTVPHFSLYRMVCAELRVMLKGFHWVWYLVALGLVVAQLTVPIEQAQRFILPAALIWPLPLWSAMGTRNREYGTEALLYSSPNPLTRQLTASWMGGLLITVLIVVAMILRFGSLGQLPQSLALLAGALFIPTAALAFGILTGTRKFFEVVYLLVWYVGLVDHLWALDFIGATGPSLSAGVPWVFLGGAIILMVIAVLTVRTRMRLS